VIIFQPHLPQRGESALVTVIVVIVDVVREHLKLIQHLGIAV
jgi:hypothetical protein